MHRHNAGMIEIGDRASLGQIRLGIFGFRDQSGVRHLDGDQPIQLFIVGQIHQPKAAFTEHSFDPVATDTPRMLSGRTTIR